MVGHGLELKMWQQFLNRITQKKANINNVDDDEKILIYWMDRKARVDVKSPLDLNPSLCIDLWKQEISKKYKMGLFRGCTTHQEIWSLHHKRKAIELFCLIDNDEAEALRRLYDPRGETKLHYDVVS